MIGEASKPQSLSCGEGFLIQEATFLFHIMVHSQDLVTLHKQPSSGRSMQPKIAGFLNIHKFSPSCSMAHGCRYQTNGCTSISHLPPGTSITNRYGSYEVTCQLPKAMAELSGDLLGSCFI